MRVRGVFLLEGSQKIVLGLYIQIFGLYQLYSRVNPIDVPGNILLVGGGKPSYSPRKFQRRVVQVLLCWSVLRQVLTEKNGSAKKIALTTR